MKGTENDKPTEVVWIVTPHESSEFSEWWGRSRDEGTNDEDARLREALEETDADRA